MAFPSFPLECTPCEKRGRREDENSCPLDTASIVGMSAASLYDLGKKDQVDSARNRHIPILVLQRESDNKARMEDLSFWRKSVAKRQEVKIITYPDLGHCFIVSIGKAQSQEHMKPSYIAKQIIEDLVSWVKMASLRQLQVSPLGVSQAANTLKRRNFLQYLLSFSTTL